MADKPVIVIDNVVAQAVAELTKAVSQPVELKQKELSVKVTEAPLAQNAATEATVAQIAKILSGTISVDSSGRTQSVKMDSVPLAHNAATEQSLQAVLEQLKQTVNVKAESKLPIFGEVSVSNLQRFPDTISVDNFPTEFPARINSTVLPPDAATESTLKGISEKLQDKVEVKGSLDIKSSVLPSNAATEATLAEIKTILAELLAVEKEEDRKPEYVSVEQAEIGINVQSVKTVSIQAISGEFQVLGSNDNENFCIVDSFSSAGFHPVQPYFRYLKISKSKDAKAVIVLFYN
jgi:hypothetical protein